MRTTSLLLLASASALALTSPTAYAQFSIFYEGSTAESSATWTRPALEPGPDCALSTEGVDVPYHVQGLITHAEEMDCCDEWGNVYWVERTRHEIVSEHDFDGVLLLYREAFDPLAPCANLVAQNHRDPVGAPGNSALRLDLEANVEYYIVSTGYATADAGGYTTHVRSDIWDADLELIGQPPLEDLILGQEDWDEHWYVFPELGEGCEGVYSGNMVLNEYPELVEARTFSVSTSGYYDVGYVVTGDYNEWDSYYGSDIYIYTDQYNRMRPCDNLYAVDNSFAGDGSLWVWTEFALADDVWLDAGQTYVAVGRTSEDLDPEAGAYSTRGFDGWGPHGAVVTDIDGLPPLDLDLEVVSSPSVVTPGSTVEVQVHITNNTDEVQKLDAWVRLRATEIYEGPPSVPYELRGSTPPDEVRIPRRFDGTVNYALHVPKGLSPDEFYLATFALGTYGGDVLTGDIVEFEVGDDGGADVTGETAWQLRRLNALVDGARENARTPEDGVYPNPFNPATTLRFTLDAEAVVTLVVYDVTGREVARLLDGAALEAGPHTARFDAAGLASGVYVYRLDTGAAVTTGGLTLLK